MTKQSSFNSFDNIIGANERLYISELLARLFSHLTFDLIKSNILLDRSFDISNTSSFFSLTQCVQNSPIISFKQIIAFHEKHTSAIPESRSTWRREFNPPTIEDIVTHCSIINLHIKMYTEN